MRAVSERFAALIPHVNRWTTEVEWSNDGFATFDTAGLVAGAVTASSLSQTRWTCNLRIAHGGGEPNGGERGPQRSEDTRRLARRSRALDIDRLHAELSYLPCSPRCANWLRYGIQPAHPGPGLLPGRCRGKAHDRENLGLGGRRVLNSQQWSGKTVAQHKVDRAAVVRETLLSAGIDAPELDRMAASVTLADGSPRFVWTDTRPDHDTYIKVILNSIAERQRWRIQYEHAKTVAVGVAGAVDSVSTVGQPP